MSLAAAALLLAACELGYAQKGGREPGAQTGSVAGRLTDLNSSPLAGVEVVLRNVATGAEAHTVTTRNGGYRFADLDAGEYTLAAESAERGRGELEGVVVSAGHEAHVQAAMDLEPERPGAPARDEEAESSARQERPPRLVAETRLPGTSPVSAEAAAPATVAPERIKTAMVEMPAGISERPISSAPTPALAAAMAAINPAASGLERVISAKPLQLLPIAAAVAKADPVIPALETKVSDSEVAALPAAGRNWQNFTLDAPAASESTGSAAPSYRGEDQEQAEITIDGAPTRMAFGATAETAPSDPDSGRHSENGTGGGVGGQAWNGGRGFSVSEAGVREVETVAGDVEAEAARGTGGRVAVETAHGENQIHGQAFLFDRQNTWGAKNPFSQWVENTGTSAAPEFTAVPFTPPDHEMALGAGLGGHLKRDKLFWFAAVDGYRRNDPGLSTVKLPVGVDSYGRCAGFFCAPSIPQLELLGAQLGESTSQAENDYLGVASGAYTPAGLEQLQALLGPAARSASQWVGFGRIDWQAAERHHITLEGIGADWNAPGGGLTRLSENYGSHSYGSSEAKEEWLLGRWEAYLTPNLLATTQASAGRDVLTAKPDAPSAFEQTMLNVNAWGQLPQIVVDSRYGYTIGNPSRFGQGSYPDEKLFHVQELADWVHSTLLVKAGFELDHNADATSLLRNQTGTYYYSKVQNFISDALAYEKFGLTDLFNQENPHNCNPTQNGWGALPCYSYYSQTMGPTNWRLSTSDMAGYATAQWQPAKLAVVSFGLRWEREMLPPPLAALNNAQLPITQRLPDLGGNWGPRVSLALGNSSTHAPVLRLGYGMYYARTENATLETALTQTGSLNGDLSFFIRPTDGYTSIRGTSDAPPFPYVLEGQPASVVKPGAVGFAPNFRNPEVHQAVASAEEELPGHILVTAAAIASLGRRLPISIDTNLNQPSATQTITYAVVDGTGMGPIKTPQITVPFYASWPGDDAACPYYTPVSTLLPGRPCPDYQQITQIESRANSTYEAAMVKVTRYGRRGLNLHAHYTYAHAMDWNPNETTLVAGSDVLDPANFGLEYGVSDLDVRHSAAAMVMYETPWRLKNLAGLLGNGWMLAGIGQFRSGLPYTMRTSGSLPELVNEATGAVTEGLGPGMNGSGGDNRVYGVGRNTYRYPHTWKADMRLAKRFDLGHMRDLELMAESFNLFNHQNVTELETTGYYLEPGSESELPTLNFLTGLKANTTAFGQPLNINGSDFWRERQIQFGMRMRF